MDIHAVAPELRPEGFQLVRQGGVIQRLAVRGAGQQRHINDAGALVEGHQLADLVGQLHVAP
ncbi:hypothetical protein D9M68_463330 [compost metagenome]